MCFEGEGFTSQNLRFCVNAGRLDFVPNNTVLDTEEAMVRRGLLWGVEYYLRQLPGVLAVESGYTGGTTNNPNLRAGKSGHSGHYEAVG